MVERHRAWHAITSLRLHARLDDVGRGMTSPFLDSTHAQTMSGVASHHCPWIAQTIGNVGRGMTSPPLEITHGRQRQAWHDMIAVGQHRRSNDFGCGKPSSPLGSTHGLTTSGVVCHHSPMTTYTVERCRAWHAIMALGQQTLSNDVGRCMPS